MFIIAVVLLIIFSQSGCNYNLMVYARSYMYRTWVTVFKIANACEQYIYYLCTCKYQPSSLFISRGIKERSCSFVKINMQLNSFFLNKVEAILFEFVANVHCTYYKKRYILQVYCDAINKINQRYAWKSICLTQCDILKVCLYHPVDSVLNLRAIKSIFLSYSGRMLLDLYFEWCLLAKSTLMTVI